MYKVIRAVLPIVAKRLEISYMSISRGLFK